MQPTVLHGAVCEAGDRPGVEELLRMKRFGCRTAHPSEESALTHARAGQSRC